MIDKEERILSISGGGTPEERALMIRESARVLRWRAASRAVSNLGCLVAFVASLWLVCG